MKEHPIYIYIHVVFMQIVALHYLCIEATFHTLFLYEYNNVKIAYAEETCFFYSSIKSIAYFLHRPQCKLHQLKYFDFDFSSRRGSKIKCIKTLMSLIKNYRIEIYIIRIVYSDIYLDLIVCIEKYLTSTNRRVGLKIIYQSARTRLLYIAQSVGTVTGILMT